jgi:hypothetical protein
MPDDPLYSLVKPLVGILTSQTALLDDVVRELSVLFGPTDIIGEWRNFTHTNYYADEMGGSLKRCFVSFETLTPPERSIGFKELASRVEDSHRVSGKRVVNIDAGYIDANKVVLMTGKHGGHKIAVAPGVWADFLLWYNKGWEAMPWAFPDFRDGTHFDVFMEMRKRFKEQVRKNKS